MDRLRYVLGLIAAVETVPFVRSGRAVIVAGALIDLVTLYPGFWSRGCSCRAALRAAKTPKVPPGSRLIDLNVRRNTSVHGEWVDVLDQDALEDAIRAARELLSAVRHCLAAKGTDVS